jgi:hypothetical protein
MDNRSDNLLNIRPVILSAKVNDGTNALENFQNRTLRPIAKMQNDLLIAVFSNYITKHKNMFYTLSLPKKLEYVENAIQKDMKFRNSLKGMIIGQFTVEEYKVYITNSSALNKRITNLVKERLISSVQLFVRPEDVSIIT